MDDDYCDETLSFSFSSLLTVLVVPLEPRTAFTNRSKCQEQTSTRKSVCSHMKKSATSKRTERKMIDKENVIQWKCINRRLQAIMWFAVIELIHFYPHRFGIVIQIDDSSAQNNKCWNKDKYKSSKNIDRFLLLKTNVNIICFLVFL